MLTESLAATAESGPTGWSLREIARRVGVSNAATSRHFRDKRALMTVLATDAYARLADDLGAAWDARHEFVDVGAAYVRFATSNRAMFEIACRPELYEPDEASLAAQRDRVFEVLYGPAAASGVETPRIASAAAWSLVHGISTLWLQGMLPSELGDDPVTAFRRISRYLVLGPRT